MEIFALGGGLVRMLGVFARIGENGFLNSFGMNYGLIVPIAGGPVP